MKKRIIETVNDVKKIKKIHETPASNSTSGDHLDDALAEEFQPQFKNYMLVGDLVAIMILHSKHLINRTKSSRLVLYQHFCHSTWSVGDVLNELHSKKDCFPIAKNVILSVGYNDYVSNSSSAVQLVEGIEKIILKLRKRGCEDIILTNVPPAAAKSASLDRWKYLQTVNTEICRLSEKYEFVGLCNIFRLFGTPKNYFKKSKDYVTFQEINYKVDTVLYNDHRRDMISFSDVGKTVLGKHVASSIENRLTFLRQKERNKILCSIELSDSEDVEVVAVKKREPSPVVVDDADDEEVKAEIKKEDLSHPVSLLCTCKNCMLSNQQLLQDEPEEDEKPQT